MPIFGGLRGDLGVDLAALDAGELKKLVECFEVGANYIKADEREREGRKAKAGSKPYKQAAADRHARFAAMMSRIKQRRKELGAGAAPSPAAPLSGGAAPPRGCNAARRTPSLPGVHKMPHLARDGKATQGYSGLFSWLHGLAWTPWLPGI